MKISKKLVALSALGATSFSSSWFVTQSFLSTDPRRYAENQDSEKELFMRKLERDPNFSGIIEYSSDEDTEEEDDLN